MGEFEVKAISSAPTLPTCGSGRWITPLSSNRQNTVISSSSTSMPKTHISSSLIRTQRKMDSCHFWTLQCTRVPTKSFKPQFAANLLTQTIPTLGQQPLPCSQTQHAQHLNPQGQDSVLKSNCFSTGGSSQIAFQQEGSHIRQALLKCNFPPCALNSLHTKFHHRLHIDHTHRVDNTTQHS